MNKVVVSINTSHTITLMEYFQLVHKSVFAIVRDYDRLVTDRQTTIFTQSQKKKILHAEAIYHTPKLIYHTQTILSHAHTKLLHCDKKPFANLEEQFPENSTHVSRGTFPR